MVHDSNGIQPQLKRHYGSNGIYPQGLQPQWKKHGFMKDYFFEVAIVMVKDKKIQYKRCNVNEN